MSANGYGKPAPTAEGCYLIGARLGRLAVIIAVVWSALTTSSTPLAVLCWAIATAAVLTLVLRSDSP